MHRSYFNGRVQFPVPISESDPEKRPLTDEEMREIIAIFGEPDGREDRELRRFALQVAVLLALVGIALVLIFGLVALEVWW